MVISPAVLTLSKLLHYARAWARMGGPLLAVLMLTGCQNGMENQRKYEPFEASSFFADGMSARPLVPNTVARGQLRTDRHLYAGQVAGSPAEEFPFPLTPEVLARGQQRYDIYCAPCHSYTGDGNGIIVQRGFTPPPSLHEERLRLAPEGHIFDVITHGIGAMYSYGDRISPEDRWAIIAYVRALQLSQNATPADVPADQLPALEAAPVPADGAVPAEPQTGGEDSKIDVAPTATLVETGAATTPVGDATVGPDAGQVPTVEAVTLSVTVSVEVPMTNATGLSVTVALTDATTND